MVIPVFVLGSGRKAGKVGYFASFSFMAVIARLTVALGFATMNPLGCKAEFLFRNHQGSSLIARFKARVASITSNTLAFALSANPSSPVSGSELKKSTTCFP